MESSSTSPASQSKKITSFGVLLIVLLMVADIAWNQYQSFTYRKTIETLQSDHDANVRELAELKASTTQSSALLSDLYTTLSRVIDEEKAKNKTLEEKLGSLDKLAKADPQLLKKYSKIYFLNENYAPLRLVTIPTEYTYNQKTTYEIHADVLYYLQSLLTDARNDGMNLLIISAFRSFATQATVKNINVVKFGTKTANQFSAEQGFSEHQLGTTVDFTTSATKDNFSKFDGTQEYQWLKNNAYLYGFVLSYPKGNSYYAYEPWHWRFVGVELAKRIHDEGKYFYDYDQRVLDEYVTKIFDR